MLTQRHQEILEARGLDLELLIRLGVESSDKLGPDTIMIPYHLGGEVVGKKYRTIVGEKKFTQEPGSKQILYNIIAIDDPSLAGEPIIITEGEIDCWSAIQAGFLRTVSVPGGAPSVAVGERAATKYEFLDALASLPATAGFILATDTDDPGAALRQDLAQRLGMSRCRWLTYPQGCKDLNDALRVWGVRGVQEAVKRAQWMIRDEVGPMSTVADLPYAQPHETGFPGLDKHYRLRPGDLTIVTGVPGHGKSTFVTDIACRMAFRHKWVTCFASFENYPKLDQRSSLRRWFGGGLESNMDEGTKARADEWIERSFIFVTPKPRTWVSFPWIMERFAVAYHRWGARLFILDPWNELEHDRPKELTMTEYVGQCLRDLKAFCREMEVHVIVVAHPAKARDPNNKTGIITLNDIADSAHWYNKTDVGIIVYRDSDDQTLVRVAKSRYQNEIGRPGDVMVRYVWQKATYEGVGSQHSPDPRIPD